MSFVQSIALTKYLSQLVTPQPKRRRNRHPLSRFTHHAPGEGFECNRLFSSVMNGLHYLEGFRSALITSIKLDLPFQLRLISFQICLDIGPKNGSKTVLP